MCLLRPRPLSKKKWLGLLSCRLWPMIQTTPDPKKSLRTLHVHPFSTSINAQKQQTRPRNIQLLDESSPARSQSPLQAALHQHQVLQALVGSEPAGEDGIIYCSFTLDIYILAGRRLDFFCKHIGHSNPKQSIYIYNIMIIMERNCKDIVGIINT